MDQIREFEPGNTLGAIAFMHELQAEYNRVYVEEFGKWGWRTIFGDQIPHATQHLARVTDGVRFRIRAIEGMQWSN